MISHPTISVDETTFERYAGLSLPRHVSYPMPTWWHDIGPDDVGDFRRRMTERATPVDLSLYVHVPFCQALCKFCACCRVILRKTQPGAPERPDQTRTRAGQTVEIAGRLERDRESLEFLRRRGIRLRSGLLRGRRGRDGTRKGQHGARDRRIGLRGFRGGRPAREAETAGQAGEEVLHRRRVGRGAGIGSGGQVGGGGAARAFAPLLGDAGGKPATVKVGSCRLGSHLTRALQRPSAAESGFGAASRAGAAARPVSARCSSLARNSASARPTLS